MIKLATCGCGSKAICIIERTRCCAVTLTRRERSRLTRVGHCINGVLVTTNPWRESKRYCTSLWMDSIRRDIFYCHICLKGSDVFTWISSGAHSGFRHTSPAQRDVDVWRKMKLSGCCLVFISHSTHQNSAPSCNNGLNDFTHRICNIQHSVLCYYYLSYAM